MPASKRTYSRYLVIHECLSTKTKIYWTAEELLLRLKEHDLQVNKRTLHYDLQNMRYDTNLGYKAPIQYCKIKRGYYYTDPAYTIDKLSLNPDQVKALMLAQKSLAPYKNIPSVSNLNDTVTQIVKISGHGKSPGMVKEPSIEFEKATYFKGLEHMEPLESAIYKQQVIKISYTKHDTGITSIHTFHPYQLRENKNRWYTIGLSVERDKVIILGLDRINFIEQTSLRYIPNTINLEELFSHTLGITIGQGPPECIILHCKPLIGKYLKTQLIHHTQHVVSEDQTGVIVGLELSINYELIALILSYGPDVKVLSPESLQRQVKTLLVDAANLYPNFD